MIGAHPNNNIEHNSYQIMCPTKLKDCSTPEKAAKIILEHLDIPEDQFRLGNTKVLDSLTVDLAETKKIDENHHQISVSFVVCLTIVFHTIFLDFFCLYRTKHQFFLFIAFL